jgi:hypothetical protein
MNSNIQNNINNHQLQALRFASDHRPGAPGKYRHSAEAVRIWGMINEKNGDGFNSCVQKSCWVKKMELSYVLAVDHTFIQGWKDTPWLRKAPFLESDDLKTRDPYWPVAD